MAKLRGATPDEQRLFDKGTRLWNERVKFVINGSNLSTNDDWQYMFIIRGRTTTGVYFGRTNNIQEFLRCSAGRYRYNTCRRFARLPYRKNRPQGYRPVHHALCEALEYENGKVVIVLNGGDELAQYSEIDLLVEELEEEGLPVAAE